MLLFFPPKYSLLSIADVLIITKTAKIYVYFHSHFKQVSPKAVLYGINEKRIKCNTGFRGNMLTI
jgi:hypothetical protein